MGNKNKPNFKPFPGNVESRQASKNSDFAEQENTNKLSEKKDIENPPFQREKTLSEREQELKTAKEAVTKKESELNEKFIQLEEMELQAKNGFPKLFEEKFAPFKKQLELREAQCLQQLEFLEIEKDKLRQREHSIRMSEIERDNGFGEERAKLEVELESKRSSLLIAIEKDIAEMRNSRLAILEVEIAQSLKDHMASIQLENDELEKKRQTFLKNQLELDKLKEDLEYKAQRLKSSKDSLDERESNLKDEVGAKVIERKQSFEIEKTSLQDEISRLRDSIRTSNELISNFEECKRKLGDDDCATVLLRLKTYEEEIKNLRDELITRPTREMQDAFDRLKSEKEALLQEKNRLGEENGTLRSSSRAQSDLEMKVGELSDKNKSLLTRYELVDADNDRLMEDLTRLRKSYKREEDRERRIRDIEAPYIEKELPRKVEEIEELQWLEQISKSCLDYGLKFPRRILYAFHTAIKTSEWSSITILAGVSGTGKSELPRLYSHFGGMNFLSLSVQPNWDSQESMLGFFNSIDDKFDAQPVLRLLAQSQKSKSDDYPFGLEDVISLVLLDEMNLAHIELYFAEFLSKFELRRGSKGEVPSLEVKLGAGIPHYNLPLGRNVLWAGTMNQDETTKSLSDKVLDRGIVINFPRPTTLERRRLLKSLGEPAPLLPRKLWQSWWCRDSSFSDEQILPLKKFVEEMNMSLSKVGKALGHRVWQSIEYYMSNYPDVREAQRNNDDTQLAKAMKIAFEDQLVQKVMPKLRGIETRGKSKSDCLDKIRTQLVNNDYTIVDDFDLACEFGYGQFIWYSANYLKDDDSVVDLENKEN